jgi:hypothetical protein
MSSHLMAPDESSSIDQSHLWLVQLDLVEWMRLHPISENEVTEH